MECWMMAPFLKNHLERKNIKILDVNNIEEFLGQILWNDYR